MRKWLTAFALTVTMIGGAVSVTAHEPESSNTKMGNCCKKARSTRHEAGVSMARLCCNLNCSEPGGGASNTSPSFSPQPVTTPVAAVIPRVAQLNNRNVLSRFGNSPRLKGSSPKYIQHLALLI
jgi:hypothetical protein